MTHTKKPSPSSGEADIKEEPLFEERSDAVKACETLCLG